jgi:hypothetical protein
MRLRRMPAGWKLEFGRLGFFGGAAVSMPADDTDLRRRLMLYIGGGAASNIACGMTAALLASGRDATGALLGVFALISLCFAALALYPAKAAGVQTDGSRLLLLWRGGPAADRWVASVNLVALSFRGQRPSDWPEESVRCAVEHEDISPDDFQAAMIGYAVALDRGDLAAARTYLDRARWSLPLTAFIVRPEYFIERAFQSALDGDVDGADDALAAVSGGMIRQASLLRARAARELAAGNAAEAANLARLGIANAPNDWDAGIASIDLHWLERFANSAQSGAIT